MDAILAVILAAAWVQEPPRQDPATEFVLARLKERLKLTDEQAARVKEIYSRDQQERDKLEEARAAKVAELLSDEQKKLFEEMRREGSRPGQMRIERLGGGGRGGRLGQPDLDEVKRELALTDDQAAKIKPVLDEFGEAMQKRMEGLRDGGLQGLNLGEEMRKFQEQMAQVNDKVKAHLTEEQKGKYDQYVERRTGWMRMIPLFAGGAPAAPGRAPRASVEERVRRAMEALKVEKEAERAAIGDLVARLLRAQDALEDHARASREKLAELSRNRDLSDAALEQRLQELREERRKKEKDVSSLQRELSEIVTYRQEVELLLQGILR